MSPRFRCEQDLFGDSFWLFILMLITLIGGIVLHPVLSGNGGLLIPVSIENFLTLS